MWRYLISAIALMLVIEGLLPMLFTDKWRETLTRLLKLDNHNLRVIAFFVFSVGVVLWCLVQHVDVLT